MHYEVILPIGSIHLINNALKLYLERWSGGTPAEQQHIRDLQYNFQRIVLEESLTIGETDDYNSH